MSNPIEDTKEQLEKVKSTNANIDIESIFDIVKNTSTSNTPTVRSKRSDHSPVNTLEVVRQKLSETRKIKDEQGIEQTVPAYSEEDKVKIIFSLLAERGLNLLDNLEKILEKDGYRYSQMDDGMMEEGSNKLIENINDTFSKTTDVLKEIAEMQFKKSKLELDKENLRIQDYKAKLKEKELQIKEKAVNKAMGASGNTNIIAVASQAELLALMKSQKQQEVVKEAEVIDEKE